MKPRPGLGGMSMSRLITFTLHPDRVWKSKRCLGDAVRHRESHWGVALIATDPGCECSSGCSPLRVGRFCCLRRVVLIGW